MTTQREYDNRESDKKINLLIQQIGLLQDSIVRIELKQQEIGMRQAEFTIPKLDKIEKCLFHSNGHKSLLEEHAVCQKKIEGYDKMTDKLVAIIITIVVQCIFTVSGFAWVILRKI